MLFEILIAILVGIIIGTFTGLTPGVHINLVCVILLAISPFLLVYCAPLTLAVFIISMSITHTFLDSIPSIFLGAPDADQALGVLPGHKLLLRGYGYGAVYLTIVGSIGGLMLSAILIPLLIPLFFYVYPKLQPYVGIILIIISCIMILREKNKLWALFVFLLSGTLGIIVFSIPNLKQPLFPLLSGLFGISTLILSLSENVRIPKQKTVRIPFKKSIGVQAIGASVVAGSFTAFFPGIGPSQGAVLSQQLTRKIGDNGFLILIGGVNTVGMLLSLVTLISLDKARNGSIIAISALMKIDDYSFIILIICSLIAGIICVFWTLYLAKKFSSFITLVDYQKIAIGVIIFVSIIGFFLSGWIGLLIMLISSSVGLISPLVGVSRSHSMACLILPVIFYFIL